MSTQAPLPFVVRKSDRRLRGKKNTRLQEVISSDGGTIEAAVDGADVEQAKCKPLRRASTRRAKPTAKHPSKSPPRSPVCVKPSTPTRSKTSTPCRVKSTRNPKPESRDQTIRRDNRREPLSPLKLDDGNVAAFHGVRSLPSKSTSLSSSSSTSPPSPTSSHNNDDGDARLDTASGHTELTSPIRRLTFSDEPRRKASTTTPRISANVPAASVVRRSKRAQSPPLPSEDTAVSSPPKSPRKGKREKTPPRHSGDSKCVPVVNSSPPRSPRKPARDYGWFL